MMAKSIDHVYQPAFWQPLEYNFEEESNISIDSTLNPLEQQTAHPRHQPNHFHTPGCNWMVIVVTIA